MVTSDSFSQSRQDSVFASRYRRLIQGVGNSRIDWITPLCILVLGITGIFFIYSAQLWSAGVQPTPIPLWGKQIAWLILGLGIYVIISLINYKILFENAHIVYLSAIALLLMLWTPLGQTRYDALRWLDFKFFLFQPAEGVKIGTLILVASILARSKIGSVEVSLKALIKVAFVVFPPMVLIFIQPDLGSTLAFPFMTLSLLYVSKLSKKFFIVAFAIFVLMAGILAWDSFQYQKFLKENNLSAQEGKGRYEGKSWIPLKDYQRNRILSFIAPELIDPQGTHQTWNMRQSLISVGSGGLHGKGWAQGTQAKLGYLPQSVAHNDFIFSVISEEKGFLGGMFIMGLYAIIVSNGIRIAGIARDRFGMLLAVGASVIFMVHIFINIGMTIGLMPITGLPLPFLSYGGSFLLSCCILQGLIQSVYRFRKDFS